MSIELLKNNKVDLASVESRVDQTGAGTSDTIVIPGDAKGPIAVNLILRNAGTAEVEFSTSPVASLIGGGTVYWQTWPLGAVTASTTDAAIGISALRLKVTSGNWTLEVRG